MARSASTLPRKPSTSKAKASAASRQKAAAAPRDDDEDSYETVNPDDELGHDEGEADGDDDDEAEQDETVISETQYDPPTGKGKAKAGSTTAKKGATGSAPKALTKRKAKDELARDGNDDDSDQAGPSAKERKLQAQLDATKMTLAEVQAAFKKLSELRHTRAEEAETRLRAISDERLTAATNTVATYKAELDTLRSEVSTLQSTAYASPRTKAAQATNARIVELEANEADYLTRLQEAERAAVEKEREWNERLENEIRTREKAWKAERKQLTLDLDTARNDYAAEVTHSKSLQAKLKALPASSSAAAAAAASNSTASSSAATIAKLTEENDLTLRKLQLNEDLTGFTVHSIKEDSVGPTYVCTLFDCVGVEEKSLNFKLTFYTDGTVGYDPDIDPARDSLLISALAPQLRKFMRFEAENCGEWFQSMYKSINKR
ncbi:hypothetical protein JCM10212_001877 [Sporobolomyces blumeae]